MLDKIKSDTFQTGYFFKLLTILMQYIGVFSGAGTSLPNDPRIGSNSFTTPNGDVISYVNISRVEVPYGGEYWCFAVNNVGRAEHGARLNVYGEFNSIQFNSIQFNSIILFYLTSLHYIVILDNNKKSKLPFPTNPPHSPHTQSTW
jgi:hypothetical protein